MLLVGGKKVREDWWRNIWNRCIYWPITMKCIRICSRFCFTFWHKTVQRYFQDRNVGIVTFEGHFFLWGHMWVFYYTVFSSSRSKLAQTIWWLQGSNKKNDTSWTSVGIFFFNLLMTLPPEHLTCSHWWTIYQLSSTISPKLGLLLQAVSYQTNRQSYKDHLWRFSPNFMSRLWFGSTCFAKRWKMTALDSKTQYRFNPSDSTL